MVAPSIVSPHLLVILAVLFSSIAQLFCCFTATPAKAEDKVEFVPSSSDLRAELFLL